MGIGAMAVAAAAGLVAIVAASHAVERLRPRPQRPARLAWDSDLPVEYAEVAGIRMRYTRAGSGPALVLLHTLRTQLDIFQKMIPELAKHFTVYACDYPGHGWSDIPLAAYAPEDFYRWVGGFLERLDIRRACVTGVSIGATIALVLAARGNPRITSVVAVNPYDYPPAGGIRHSSPLARLILGPAGVPFLGPTLMRLRSRFVVDRIMKGGVADAGALPPALGKELNDTGARPGHYRGFLSLLANEWRWSAARDEYPRIGVPVLLVYGEQDWAPAAARERVRGAIPLVSPATISGGGHFLPLDRPRELTAMILRFAQAQAAPR